MPICTMNKLLHQARSKKRAVGAFNVGNMEMAMGIIRAAEACATPVILQVAEKRLHHSPLHLIAPMMVQAAHQATVDVAVQLDHGFSRQIIEQAVNYGFTSIMFDGSALPLRENIRLTTELRQWLTGKGVDLEAEIGVLGGAEGGAKASCIYSDPAEAEALAHESGCTALAVSIGNAHGHYTGEPRLRYDILHTILDRVQVPLVLHGGSGLSVEQFHTAIEMGICKINIATAHFDALTHSARSYLQEVSHNSYFPFNEAMVDGVYKSVCHCIAIFNRGSNQVAS